MYHINTKTYHNMSTTIRKNSKEYKEVIASKNWSMHALGNGFSGEIVDNVEGDAKHYFVKLTKDARGYSLNVHSNLWYTKCI